MTREPRGAVISIRISEDEQARLRERAQERGMSVSELLRSAALAESNVEPETASPTTQTRPAAFVENGFEWCVPEGGRADGATLTL
jgi:hypothetical protein